MAIEPASHYPKTFKRIEWREQRSMLTQAEKRCMANARKSSDEFRDSLLRISGKEVRTLMQRGSRKSFTFAWEGTKRLMINGLRTRNSALTPNKIARMIRRNTAMADVRATRPLISIRPDFSALRNTDGNDLDAVFSGQDES